MELLWLKKSLCVEGEAKERERPWEEGWGIGREILKTVDLHLECKTKEPGL